jgi:hypothetical protein
MAKKGNFAGWFRPSLRSARNGHVEAGAAHSTDFHQIVRMANVFRLGGGVDCVFGDVLGVDTDPVEVPHNKK